MRPPLWKMCTKFVFYYQHTFWEPGGVVAPHCAQRTSSNTLIATQSQQKMCTDGPVTDGYAATTHASSPLARGELRKTCDSGVSATQAAYMKKADFIHTDSTKASFCLSLVKEARRAFSLCTFLEKRSVALRLPSWDLRSERACACSGYFGHENVMT